ncbi:thioredoxin [Clostridium sp.]|uniref:thioredoxin n=1 Tax=Clostridium sp. TaxID=1506 RepID=UPI002631DADA|nr:thioredoxin [Clostridium sp.]
MKEILQKDFDEIVINNKGITVVDFWAQWCGPCKMLAPVLEAVEKDLEEVRFVKVEVDENEELADKYQISTIPTLLIFKDGEIVDTIVGFMPKDVLKAKINKNL